ncbi:putative WD40/YVTN repeat-like-containing domain superfamily [Helianthus debilis subsp. tardiflorus]
MAHGWNPHQQRFFPRSLLLWAIIIQSLSSIKILSCSSSSLCQHHHIHQQTNRKFEQKTTIFWEFEEESNTWVQVKSPYDLLSCVNNNCTKVGIIEPVNDDDYHDDQTRIELGQEQDLIKIQGPRKKKVKTDEKKSGGLGSRNRISVTKMTDDSIWVTGLSGSIYERFWNGIQWVIAPHELPLQAGYAVSVFLIKHIVLALSEAGILYQMQLNENSQPIWVEFPPILDSSTDIRIKSGVISHDMEKIYFCTKNGLLLELSEITTPRWMNHGKPPGADVAAIVDAPEIRPQVVFTISSSGDLYELDPSSKPMWKKHIWSQESTHDTTLTPMTSCTAHRRSGPHSDSLFLLTKGGNLVERRLHQRKWKWVVHGSPKDQQFTSMTPVTVDETYTSSFSLFLATTSGSIIEYNISKQEGKKTWVNHMHPPHAKVAKGVSGLQLQMSRHIFPLDDGRLGELHQSKTGGDGVGPTPSVNRRRMSTKYTWSIIDAPESEGWNTEYCTEDRGPLNCISGVKDETNDDQTTTRSCRRRSGNNKGQENYYLVSTGSKTKDDAFVDRISSVNVDFRLRVMYEGRSFILVTENGISYEFVNVENVWFWLKHEHAVGMKGVVGSYNGSLFLVNENDDLIVGEREGNEFTWINGSAMKKGRRVVGGPPWDVAPSKAQKVTPDDSMFFVGKSGGLLQLTVALKKLKWKDCRNPSNTKIASIIDQEVFRENIVFVVGTDGHLYQYNKVSGLWHGHHQSRHMVLSKQPGTAMRGSPQSLSGSLFMISEDGRLIEYYWNPMDGWGWVEHGSPYPGVTLVGSTGPCLAGNQLFLIGSDGNVYLRYWDQTLWKWSDCGFPSTGNVSGKNRKGEGCIDQEILVKTRKEYHEETENCDPKVAPTRPIPFTENSVIFELNDGRLAEMRRTENLQWVWWRTIGSPTTRCNAVYWNAAAS